MTTRSALPCTLLAAALTLATAACSGGSATSTTSTTSTTSAATTSPGATTAQGPLAVSDPWVKAVKGGMTGVFATLRNTTDKPVHVVRAETPVASMVQLHVTERSADGAMVMKESKDGFTVPAGGTFALKPGGNHVMLMGLKQPVLSGTDVTLTLVTQDGARIPVTAPAREFNGAKETYGGMSMTANATPGAASSAPMSASPSMSMPMGSSSGHGH